MRIHICFKGLILIAFALTSTEATIVAIPMQDILLKSGLRCLHLYQTACPEMKGQLRCILKT